MVTKKTPAKASKKPPAKKQTAKKAAAKKQPAKKPPAKKPPAKKQLAKKQPAKKPPAKKQLAKKQPAKKQPAKKPPTPAGKPRRKRQAFVEGHRRKLLVVVDETPECESALAFAASRAKRTGGQLALLYVIEPDAEFQHWLGVEDIAREEGHNKAKAVFRLFSRKLKTMGFDAVVPEEIVRDGVKAAEIAKLIEEDEDIGVLVLGASKDPSGPGPLVSSLEGGRLAATFPVPITVVPGHLTTEEILALA